MENLLNSGLLSAYCLLPTAYCLLLSAFCLRLGYTNIFQIAPLNVWARVNFQQCLYCRTRYLARLTSSSFMTSRSASSPTRERNWGTFLRCARVARFFPEQQTVPDRLPCSG